VQTKAIKKEEEGCSLEAVRIPLKKNRWNVQETPGGALFPQEGKTQMKVQPKKKKTLGEKGFPCLVLGGEARGVSFRKCWRPGR